MSEPTVIAIVRKNGLEEIRVSLDSYNRHDLPDLRTYANFGGAGERRATKRGISLRVDPLPELEHFRIRRTHILNWPDNFGIQPA